MGEKGGKGERDECCLKREDAVLQRLHILNYRENDRRGETHPGSLQTPPLLVEGCRTLQCCGEGKRENNKGEGTTVNENSNK